jgi:hypothetical protein
LTTSKEHGIAAKQKPVPTPKRGFFMIARNCTQRLVVFDTVAPLVAVSSAITGLQAWTYSVIAQKPNREVL